MFPENSRETVSVSTICDEYCSSLCASSSSPGLASTIQCNNVHAKENKNYLVEAIASTCELTI